MEIRPVQADDMAAVVAIYNHYVTHSFVTFDEQTVRVDVVTRKMQEITRRYPWFVAVDGETLVGYAYASAFRVKPAYRRTVETTIYLDPDHTGHGWGLALYQGLLTDLKQRGFTQAIGVLAVPNEASVALHRFLGFQRQGGLTRVGYKFDQWIDVEYWQRGLEDWQTHE